MKNEVYLIRGGAATGKSYWARKLSSGKTCVHINNGLCEKIKLEDFKDFLRGNGKGDAIVFEEVSPKHIPRINYFIKLFSKSITYSPIFIITTQVLNLNFKGVTQYITLERA